LSYKKALIRLLDRPGGRSLLGKIATNVVQRGGGDRVEIVFVAGMWARRVGPNFFPDGPTFPYTFSHFGDWNRLIDQYLEDAKDYWLQHYLPREGDTILDVGAGRGEDAVLFSRMAGDSGRVIAIEAHPFTFSILKKFCALNSLTNVTPIQLALMDRGGTVRILESDSSWLENQVAHAEVSSGIEVRAATLNQVLEEQRIGDIAFLKMNIEGAERAALIGMEAVMDRVRKICVACHDFRADMGHGEHLRTRGFVEKFLVDHGFTLASRPDDPRPGVRDHIYGLRP
jgi:FkbM family methyltransferase